MTDASKHALPSPLALHQNREVIRVPSESIPAHLQFFVQGIEHDIRQQRR
jgi:hypothetical protein